MRILLAICLALAAAWAGYWFVGSSAVKSGVAAWFDARANDGWTAEYSDLSVQGFPSRFDTTLTAPRLADPATGLGWQAPFLQLMTLSYTPNHVIAVWPNSQRLITPQHSYTLDSTDMRASLVIDANTTLAPRRATMTATGVSITGENAAEADALSMAALRLAGERVEGAEARYHLGFAADDLAPPASLLALLGTSGADAPPRVMESAIIDATADFTAPFDRAAMEGTRPQPTRIDLARATVQWGSMALTLSGVLDIDAAGMPEGDLTLAAEGWRDMLNIARASGAITPDMANTAQQALIMMSGANDNLDVPLRVGQGRVWLGPLPIAPAPILRLK